MIKTFSGPSFDFTNMLFILNVPLIFYRDQITTTEVNMARVYNWGVKKRQAAAKTNPSTAST